MRRGGVARKMLGGGPVLVENQTARIGNVHVQVVLYAAVFLAGGPNERESSGTQLGFFAGLGFHLGDNGQEIGHGVCDGVLDEDIAAACKSEIRGGTNAQSGKVET